MILTHIFQQYQAIGDRWFATMNQHSHALFFALATLDMIWFGILLAINRGQIDSVFWRVVVQVMGLGFFLTLLENARPWVQAIIDSFVMIGQEASGVASLDPSSIMDQAIAITGNMFASMGIVGTMSHPVTAGATSIAAIIAFVCMAIVGAHVLYILIRTQLVIGLSPLLLAFSGCRWTRPVAGKYLSAVLGTGMTLTALYCMIGVADSLTQSWAAELTARSGRDFVVYLEVILSAIIYLFLVWLTPGYVADMFAGSVSVSLVEIERTAEMMMPRLRGGWGGSGGAAPVTPPVSPLAPAGGNSGLTAAWNSPIQAATSAATSAVSPQAATAAVLQQFRNAGTGNVTPDFSNIKNPQVAQALQRFANLGKKE